MLRYIPPFVLHNYEANYFQGSLNAYVLLFDIADFTGINMVLQKEGKQGAEELSRFLDNVFQLPLELVEKYGGFISGFAGDAFCAVFPDAKAESIVSVVNSIRKHFRDNPVYKTAFGEFVLQVRQTICYGAVEWQIYRNELQNEYVFLGKVMQELAELSEQKAEVIWSEVATERICRAGFQTCLAENSAASETDSVALECYATKTSECKTPQSYIYKQETLYSFCHHNYRDVTPQNEIRTAAFCFASLAKVAVVDREQTIAALHRLAAKYGGILNRLDDTDKGLVALLLFGLPHSEGKTLERICSFALETAETIADIALGISCGSVFAGKCGSGDLGEYTAFGHPVNVAARLMSKARAGEVLTDAFLWQEMHAHYDFDYLGNLNLKGIDLPVRYYKLSRQAMDKAWHQENRFVGRDNELSEIRKLVDNSVASKENTIIYVSGDAGIGKSRLVKEALVIYPTTACHKFYITCDAILSKPLEAIKQMVRTYFYYNPNLPHEAGIAMFRGLWTALAMGDVEMQRIESIIASLLGYEWQGSVWSMLPPEEKPKQLKNAFQSWVEQLTKTKPVLIHLDDGQWLDEQSKEYLQALSEKEIKPVIIVSPCRYLESGAKADLELPKHQRTDLELNNLSDEGSVELIKTILRLEHVPKDTLILITTRAMGNPLFLEQLTSFLMESGSINDKGTITGEVGYLSSFSISDIVGSRIDRLTENVRECMFNASVLGTEFNIKVLSQMLKSKPVTELETGVKNRIWKDLDELNYIFTHILIKDIVYQRMMSEKLQKLHQTAAEAMEIVYADKLEENAEEIAHHFEKGRQEIKAAEYYDKAGCWFTEKYDFTNAETNLNKAMHIRESLLSSEHPDTANSLFHTAELLSAEGKFYEAEEIYKKALALLEKGLGFEHPITINCLENIALNYNVVGRYNQAEPLFIKADILNRQIYGNNHINTVLNQVALAKLYLRMGKYAQAEPLFLNALPILRHELGYEHPETVLLLNNLANLYHKQGKFSKAEKLFLKSLQICAGTMDPINIPITKILNRLASMYMEQKKYAQAELLWIRAAEIRENILGIGHPGTVTMRRCLAILYRIQGKYEQAEPLFKSTMECVEIYFAKETDEVASSQCDLAFCYYKQNKCKEAESLYLKALEIREKALGMQHQDTVKTLLWIIELYNKTGETKKAEECQARVDSIQNPET